ncbi:hypothetical protein [Brucella intermedia]|uniref:hypothetical protein n=1 Tax=Brucella intermedia TaxID=94625 RepID=UPI00124D7E0A|nr:hypothetical protein [Brucella intermedia]KAB2717976.1 hypothetical protein F9L02_23525 [Brucella intermedia]
MNRELVKRLNQTSAHLTVLALRQPDANEDTATIMSALALTMKALSEVLQQIDEINSQRQSER